MDVLLTFTGFHDPFSLDLIGKDEQKGPILSLVSEKRFEKIILFSTPMTANNTVETQKALKNFFPNIDVDIKEVFLDDPTEYFAILKGLRFHIKDIIETIPNANYYISVASGTPQMHACWLLLAASGEIPAHILHVRPPRFITANQPVVTDIDLSSPEFPIIRSNICSIDSHDILITDCKTIIRQLGIVGEHPKMNKALEMGIMLATSEVPILVLGETGTGKELFAKFIHRVSGRTEGNFVPINCGAIPKELVESILFGHKKGAFTGAIKDQRGKFVLADKGTLFLDELGELPLDIQVKLLRVLQDGIIEPVGATDFKQVDVRIIAATNKDLRKSIKDGFFREDLYYRLNIGEIYLPPLHERKSDIPKIALHILDRINANLKFPKRLSQAALKKLQIQSWPGNVRELENAIERSARLTRNNILEADDLILSTSLTPPDNHTSIPEPHNGFSMNQFFDEIRTRLISQALDLTKGNQSEAARLLGVSPQAIHKFIKKYGYSYNQS